MHCNPVQGQYRARTGFSLCSKFSQGKPCFHYREPLFSLQGPCIHYREFPVRITTQGNPCSHYREWVCSVCAEMQYVFRHYTRYISKNIRDTISSLVISSFEKAKKNLVFHFGGGCHAPFPQKHVVKRFVALAII